MPTGCNRGFYCRSYCLLNICRAPLRPSSGAQEYYTVVAACGISCSTPDQQLENHSTTMPIIRSSRVLYSGCCLWYFVLWFSSCWCWCGAEGYVSGLQDAAASCKPDTQPTAPHQTNNLKSTAPNTTGSNHCIILLSS